jgi:hypothetical protein
MEKSNLRRYAFFKYSEKNGRGKNLVQRVFHFEGKQALDKNCDTGVQ